MGKKLLLINPVNHRQVGLTAGRNSSFPPLGLGIVAALTPDDWDIEILDENVQPFQFKETDLGGPRQHDLPQDIPRTGVCRRVSPRPFPGRS